MKFNSKAYDKLYPRKKQVVDTYESSNDDEMLVTDEEEVEEVDVSSELAVEETTDVGGIEDGITGSDNSSIEQ